MHGLGILALTVLSHSSSRLITGKLLTQLLFLFVNARNTVCIF